MTDPAITVLVCRARPCWHGTPHHYRRLAPQGEDFLAHARVRCSGRGAAMVCGAPEHRVLGPALRLQCPTLALSRTTHHVALRPHPEWRGPAHRRQLQTTTRLIFISSTCSSLTAILATIAALSSSNRKRAKRRQQVNSSDAWMVDWHIDSRPQPTRQAFLDCLAIPEALSSPHFTSCAVQSCEELT